MSAVRFARGDLLRARDLRDDVAAEARRQALHVRAVHDTFGVALGFAVALTEAADALVVGPGLAYDRCGGALVSAATTKVPPPVADGRFDLVAAVDCARVRFRWAAPGSALQTEVELVRVRADAGTLADLDVSVRRAARPPQGTVRGGVFTGTPEWSALEASLTVATGGFERTPFYVAQLVDREQQPRGMLGPFVELTEPSASDFRLVARWAAPAGDAQALRESLEGELTVAWVGVEPPSRFGPDFGADGLDPRPPDPNPDLT